MQWIKPDFSAQLPPFRESKDLPFNSSLSSYMYILYIYVGYIRMGSESLKTWVINTVWHDVVTEHLYRTCIPRIQSLPAIGALRQMQVFMSSWAEPEAVAALAERPGTKPSVLGFILVACSGYPGSLEFPTLTPERKSSGSMPFYINYISTFVSSHLWNWIFF